MTAGTVATVTPDWRGDMLAAATLATDVVLTVEDPTDFDEDGGWLTVGESSPIEYLSCDDEASTVTLAAAVGAVFEVGDPVREWDPTSGAQTVEYVATVDLDNGSVSAVIPHELIPSAGVDNLTGASVTLTDAGDEWSVLEVNGREPLLDLSYGDPETTPTGQAFSDTPPPATTDGFPEGFAWWQLDADGNALGVWKATGGAWVPMTVVTIEALQADNVLTKALNGQTITGATMQTRGAPERGIKLIAGVDPETGTPIDAFYVYDEAGVPFITAVPREGMAVVAGLLKSASLTVSPLQPDDKTSIAGLFELVRNPDGTPGVFRLTAYTTRPASAPTVTTSYDTVQFTDDGLWANRHGWATDGTSWFTQRATSPTQFVVERWNAAGTLAATSAPGSGAAWGVAVSGTTVYALSDFFVVAFDTTTLAVTKTGNWTTWLGEFDELAVTATIGVDAGTGEILIAYSRSINADKVRIRRFTMPATSGNSMVAGTFIDTAFGYANSLAGVTYGTHDLGANRYIFTTTGGGQFRVVNTSGAAVSAEDWQAGTGLKVGFTYAGGAFVSMDQDGIMRTYTGQDKATAIGSTDLIKYVSNTLANATLETDQSPRAKITVDKRTKLNVSTSGINGGGANAPDRVKVYVGKATGTGADPGRAAMWKQTPTPTPVNLYPDPSFESAAVGTAASWAAVSGSTTPTVSTDRAWLGTQSIKLQRGAGTAIQVGSRTITALLTNGAGAYSYAIRAWIPAAVPSTGNTGIRIAGAGTATQDKDTDLRDQWVTLTGTLTWDGSGAVILYGLDSAITAGYLMYLDGIHVVPGSTPPTTYVEGSDAVGVTSGTYPSIATSGSNPPAANGFAAAGGTVQEIQLSDGSKVVDALGNIGAGAFRNSVDGRADSRITAKMKSGTTNSGTLVAGTQKTVAVSFGVTLSAVPKVVCCPVSTDAGVNKETHVVPGSETTTGCSISFVRASGTAAFDANWIALVP